MSRSKPWLKLGIAAAVLIAGYWLFNNWNYGPLNSFRGEWGMGHGGFGGHMMGYGHGMGIGMLLIWGLILFAIVSLIYDSFSKGQGPRLSTGRTEDALQILKRRYASGDIDKTEFDDMRRHLNI